jgi:hypothetical protein
MKYLGILAAVAVVLVGFIYYLLFATPIYKPADDVGVSVVPSATESEVTEVEPRQGVGTLSNLRLLGENLECTILYEDENTFSTVEGTYFVSDGDMRGDFLTEAPDLSGQVLSSIIVKDDMMYMWSEIEGELYGVKVDLALVEDDAVDTNEPVDLDADVEYDCKPWPQVDRTVFEPPSSVLFQDVSALLRGGMQYGTIYDEALIPEFAP